MLTTVFQPITDLRKTNGKTVLESDRTVLTSFGKPIAVVTRIDDVEWNGSDECPAIGFQDFYRQVRHEIDCLREEGWNRAVIVRSNYNGPGTAGKTMVKAVLTVLDDDDMREIEAGTDEVVSEVIENVLASH